MECCCDELLLVDMLSGSCAKTVLVALSLEMSVHDPGSNQVEFVILVERHHLWECCLLCSLFPLYICIVFRQLSSEPSIDNSNRKDLPRIEPATA